MWSGGIATVLDAVSGQHVEWGNGHCAGCSEWSACGVGEYITVSS